MVEYTVAWRIDVDATSPEAAAEIAERLMLDPTRWGNIFEVRRSGTENVELIEVNDGVGRFFSTARKHG